MLLQRVCLTELRGQQGLRPLVCRALTTSHPRLEVKPAGKEHLVRVKLNSGLPIYTQQKTDQDWGNVWPAARTFSPATVPFPVRQGYPASGKPTPDKWGNAELMKIPNFLHLTPPVIKRQCEALKKFCTTWPARLETATKQEKHFPVTISKSSYLHSSPTVRDSKARIVTLQVSLKSLELDQHGRDKLLRLVGERYQAASDRLTLVADRCPLSKQNYEYCQYLMTVLYNESVKMEPWEHEKEVADREKFIWEGSPSQAAAQTALTARRATDAEEVLKEYELVVTDLHNEGEDETTIERYKESVMRLLNLADPQDAAKVAHSQVC
ncbi:28S ribosomal protein S35, mitochondrial [Chionoecetes opilio]|uniref:28S ribosomal protein S35, mitochondrial n=1 Tax=Chionoecetes opilio TaxID=41210 RepID=A0A8J5D626_CHIOP|nr:28S ribosomal protein S35, mitochondrial [Chionoecetes opilio]